MNKTLFRYELAEGTFRSPYRYVVANAALTMQQVMKLVEDYLHGQAEQRELISLDTVGPVVEV